MVLAKLHCKTVTFVLSLLWQEFLNIWSRFSSLALCFSVRRVLFLARLIHQRSFATVGRLKLPKNSGMQRLDIFVGFPNAMSLQIACKTLLSFTFVCELGQLGALPSLCSHSFRAANASRFHSLLEPSKHNAKTRSLLNAAVFASRATGPRVPIRRRTSLLSVVCQAAKTVDSFENASLQCQNEIEWSMRQKTLR